MSQRLFPGDVLFDQRLLSCCNLYHDDLDGRFGPNTDAAEQAFLAQCDRIAAAGSTFDPRSERNIRTLLLEVQPLCRESLRRIRATGVDARVISGTRTYAEQQALFNQGRFGNPGPIVTKAEAGESWHNFGRAWDIGIFEGNKYLGESPEYANVSAVAKIDGVQWGGDWKTFKDRPHYQVIGDFDTLGAVRENFERGGR